MSHLGIAAFDLALTSTVAFWVSVSIAWSVLVITRIRMGGIGLLLLLAPFLKVGFDLVRGAAHAGELAQTVGDGLATPGGSFVVGFGLGPGRVNLQALLSRRVDDAFVPVSLGDHLATAAPPSLRQALSWLGLAVVFVSASLVARRVAATLRFERQRTRLRCTAARRVSRRGRVDVYVSFAHHGSPFAGGVLFPYVCLPIESMLRLTRAERRAALEHELAHHRSGDILIRQLVSVLTDLFWFIPGIRGCAARAFAQIELNADQRAVAAGTSPGVLASSLVRIAELDAARLPEAVAAHATGGSALGRRVEALTSGFPAPRRGFARIPARLLVGFVAVQTVLYAVVGGFRI